MIDRSLLPLAFETPLDQMEAFYTNLMKKEPITILPTPRKKEGSSLFNLS